MDDQRITRLTPLSEALARIEALTQPVEAQEADVKVAVGHVLAADVTAPKGRPEKAVALRDGWAVQADDLAEAGSHAAVPLRGIPHRIDTGEQLPSNADTVAPVDVVVELAGRAEANAPVIPGEGVLPAGADARAGDVLLRAGTIISASDVAALAAAGVERLTIRRPRVRIERDRDGLLANLVTEEGGIVSLDSSFDATIRIGGTGTGRNDAAVQRLAREGRVEFHGVGIAPGETAAFGMVDGKPVLLLPGRLDGRLAAWLLLGHPLLSRLSGRTAAEFGTPAKLKRKVSSRLGLTEVIPVRVTNGEAEPIASGYWPLAAIAQSDGWIVIPADSEGYPAGIEVVVRRWP